MYNPTISLYNGVKDTTGSTITAFEAISLIGSDTLSKQITAIANCADDKKRAALKIKLLAVTWSGTFEKRKAELLTQYSHLICLDFDHLKDASKTKQSLILQAADFFQAIFLSPSGKGLKLICSVADGPEHHAKNFRALVDFIQRVYGLTADESGKDVNRLCFLSWDKSIWVAEGETVPFSYKDFEMPDSYKRFEEEEKQRKPTEIHAHGKFENLRAFTDKKFTYSEGNRNKYINGFAMNCKTHGISFDDCEEYCATEFSDYIQEHSIKDLISVIASVYNNPKFEFGKFEKGKKTISKKQKESTKNEATTGDSPYNETIKFWYTVTKQDKNGNPVVDQTTGEVKEETKFDHDALTFFLYNNGFRKMKLGEKGYQFVRIQKNLLEAIEPEDINHFLMTFLHKDVKPNKDGVFTMDDVQDELCEVRRMYKRGINTYTKTSLYTSLPEIHPKFLRDTKTTTYLYFENGYVEVTGTEKKLHLYTELNANIWSKQRKQFEIKLCTQKEIEESDVYKFLNYSIVGEGMDDKKDGQRFLSMLTTIGYCIDGYKDPTNTKAPVFQDRKINSSAEDANGGSGKTLTAHFIAKMLNTCMVDGKAFKFDAPYPYDTFRIDQKLIVYNDVNKRFQFDLLFHKITEDFTFDKRYQDAIVIPHEDSPKHLVITNYALSGDTSSFRRRQHIVEFSDYFNDEHTPKDEFGHSFFIDWDQAEWNRFYNFMLHCVQLYKEKGLVKFPSTNVQANRLILLAGEEFIDWMDELFIGDKEAKPVRALENNDRTDLFEAFKNDVKRWAKLENSNKFSAWVKMWAEMRGLHMDTKKSGRKYSWTFTAKAEKK